LYDFDHPTLDQLDRSRCGGRLYSVHVSTQDARSEGDKDTDYFIFFPAESNSYSLDEFSRRTQDSRGSIPSCLRHSGGSKYDRFLSFACPSRALRLSSESV